jgi:hypothetical protein
MFLTAQQALRLLIVLGLLGLLGLLIVAPVPGTRIVAAGIVIVIVAGSGDDGLA